MSKSQGGRRCPYNKLKKRTLAEQAVFLADRRRRNAKAAAKQRAKKAAQVVNTSQVVPRPNVRKTKTLIAAEERLEMMHRSFDSGKCTLESLEMQQKRVDDLYAKAKPADDVRKSPKGQSDKSKDATVSDYESRDVLVAADIAAANAKDAEEDGQPEVEDNPLARYAAELDREYAEKQAQMDAALAAMTPEAREKAKALIAKKEEAQRAASVAELKAQQKRPKIENPFAKMLEEASAEQALSPKGQPMTPPAADMSAFVALKERTDAEKARKVAVRQAAAAKFVSEGVPQFATVEPEHVQAVIDGAAPRFVRPSADTDWMVALRTDQVQADGSVKVQRADGTETAVRVDFAQPFAVATIDGKGVGVLRVVR